MFNEDKIGEQLFGKKLANPREFTNDEIKEKFLKHIWSLIGYWKKDVQRENVRDRLSGLAFSILVTIDGGSMGQPGYALIPSPHKEDKQFCKENGYNWHPYSGEFEHDIGGTLHDLFHNFDPQKK